MEGIHFPGCGIKQISSALYDVRKLAQTPFEYIFGLNLAQHLSLAIKFYWSTVMAVSFVLSVVAFLGQMAEKESQNRDYVTPKSFLAAPFLEKSDHL